MHRWRFFRLNRPSAKTSANPSLVKYRYAQKCSSPGGQPNNASHQPSQQNELQPRRRIQFVRPTTIKRPSRQTECLRFAPTLLPPSMEPPRRKLYDEVTRPTWIVGLLTHKFTDQEKSFIDKANSDKSSHFVQYLSEKEGESQGLSSTPPRRTQLQNARTRSRRRRIRPDPGRSESHSSDRPNCPSTSQGSRSPAPSPCPQKRHAR